MVDSSLLGNKTIYYTFLNRISWTEELLFKTHINLRVNICGYSFSLKVTYKNPETALFLMMTLCFLSAYFFILVSFPVQKKIKFF